MHKQVPENRETQGANGIGGYPVIMDLFWAETMSPTESLDNHFGGHLWFKPPILVAAYSVSRMSTGPLQGPYGQIV